MLYQINKVIHLIIGGMICFIPVATSQSDMQFDKHNQWKTSKTEKISHSGNSKGYRDVVFYKDRFLAVGTDGRIDYISKTGEVTHVTNNFTDNLNCVINEDNLLIAAGENGAIIISSNGRNFNKINSGTDENINEIICTNGMLIAGADRGLILISKHGHSWSSINLDLKGDIISVTADNSSCYGVTDYGEIIRSSDFTNWEITDYNELYSGYSQACIFKKVLLADKGIVIIGKHDNGTPAVIFSSLGNVWTERSLAYTDDNGIYCMATNNPNDIVYVQEEDQFFLACDNGEILSLPSCSKCNVSLTLTENDIHAIICKDDFLLCVGEAFSVNILNL